MGNLWRAHQLYPPYLNLIISSVNSNYMSQNALIEKIKAEVASDVAQIKESREAELAKIQHETELALEAKRTAQQASLEKELAHLELVAIAKAKQTGNIAVQVAKRTAIDALFSELVETLAQQPADGYVKTFAAHATRILPPNISAISVQAPKNRLAETESILKELGITATVTPNDAIGAGLIVYTADGVYDVTLNRIIEEKRPELEMEIVNTVMA